jgi:hypothetical protein
MARRGVTIVIGIVCLVSALSLMNTVLGPALGIQATTGVQDDINESESKFRDDVDGSVTAQGNFNPLAALGQVSRALGLLPVVPTLLVNLGVPVPVATFVSSPLVVVAGFTLTAIALRFGL